MRRSLALLFAVLLAFTLGAAPPASILGTPVLIVYPFAANGGDVNREAGSRLAVAIATQIADLGGVEVRPPIAGTDRQDYLDTARRGGADYYIAGYITPLGDGVSLVEQLVSTQTGIVVYSNTAQVRTYSDAVGQGDVLREALLRHHTRNLGAYAAPPPAATPTRAAAAGPAARANIGRLFGRKKREQASPAAPKPAPTAAAAAIARATATPAPAAPAPATPSPVPPAPPPALAAAVNTAATPRGPDFGILEIGGPAADERRSFTGAALRNDIIANHRRVAGAGGTRAAACSTPDVGTLLGGDLSTRNRGVDGKPQTLATLELLAYDCDGNVVYRRTFARDTRGDWRTAVDGVVAAAVAAFLREPASGHHR